MQLHALVMAIFASVIAPFGGFFASGFKRSFKIKDFGDSIPGHGGMTDRMDCQVATFLPHSQPCTPKLVEMLTFGTIFYFWFLFARIPLASLLAQQGYWRLLLTGL